VALEFDIWSFYNSMQTFQNSGGLYQITVDGNSDTTAQYTTLTGSCTSANYSDSQGVIVEVIFKYHVQIFISHTYSSSLTLRITNLMSGPSTLVSFGLSNLKIYMNESVMSQYSIAPNNFPCYYGSYWNNGNGECESCHSYCKTCSGASNNQCSVCADGYYNYNNGTCAASCGGNFKAVTVNGVPSCQKPCVNTGGIFYWLLNLGCSSTCDYPLYQTVDNDGIQICSNPCYFTEENQYLNYYLYPDRTCKSSCSFPLVTRSPYICMGPCDNSSFYYYKIGVCLSSCPSPLLNITANGIKYCNSPCQQGEYIYPNTDCSSSCGNPLVITTVTGIEYCNSPCESPSQYILPNGTCTETCPFPLESSTILGIKHCNSPCPGQYIYFNGSCSQDCLSPLAAIAESLTINFCRNPCVGDMQDSYLYPNGSCIKECESPLYNRTEPGTKYCFNPCAGNDTYLYDTRLCETTCPSPNTEKNESVAQFCHFPCENIDYYYYTNDGKCRKTCSFPYEARESPLPKLCSSSLSEEEIEQIKQLAETTDNVDTASSSGILIGSLLSSSDSTSVCMGPFSKMLQYIKYMDIDYPEKVQLMLDQQSAKSEGGFSKKVLGNLWDEFPENDLPEKFEKYRAHSSFFVNFWPALFNLLVILAVTLVVVVLNKCAKGRAIKIHGISQSLLGILKWNVLLITFCGNLGDIVLFTALELQSARLDDAAAGVSFGICLLINLAAVWMVIKILDVNSAVRKARGSEETWASYKALFAAYKSQSYLQQIFLFIFIIRLIVFNGVIGYLYQYPLLQAIIINLANVLILLYLLFKRPIKQLVSLIQQIILEVVLLPFNVCVLTLAIMDAKEMEAEDERKKIGDIMVYINVVIPVLSVILMAAKLFVIGFTAYKEWKIEKAKKLPMLKKSGNGFARPKKQEELEDSSSFMSISTTNPIRNRKKFFY